MRNYFTIFFILVIGNLLYSQSINVPSDFSSIQEAINEINDGDTVFVHPGTYYENLEIENKSFVLSSLFIHSKNESDIKNTIIDGDNGDFVLKIERSAKEPMSIIGLTIQNAEDGIYPQAKFNILNCRIVNCVDGIDYESGSGGICRENTFEDNEDDGIDLDDDVDILIENNYIINNDDDGIEIRLHDYSGSLLTYVIKNNIISGNDEDGIQIIDYPGISNRILKIYNNLIINNRMVGIGCMADGRTKENYEGAAIEEQIYIINNTFSDNEYGITGGANLIAKNNIIINCAKTAYKNVSNESFVSYSCVWNNGENFNNSISDEGTIKVINPVFTDTKDYFLLENSECIDAGDLKDEYNDPADQNNIGSVQWPAQGTIRNDLGVYGGPFAADWNENIITGINDKRSGFLPPDQINLKQNYPNPFNPDTKIEYQVPVNTVIAILIFDVAGQLIRIIDEGFKSGGKYSVYFDATNLASGLYYYSLRTNKGFTQTKKMLLLR